MTPIAPDQLLNALRWRYATKAFDPARRIPEATWSALEGSLVLTPSSYGLQPWKFIVVTDAALKAALRPASWNQSQVVDCSHHVVFCARTEMHEADVQRLIDAISATRGVPAASLEGYKGMMVKDVVHGARGRIAHEWASRQCYIALGQFMAACAVLGVDACPMEGIEPAKYDTLLGLTGTGYGSVVACPAGYRLASDRYATLAKVRFPADQVIDRR
jgi:nitroreductase